MLPLCVLISPAFKTLPVGHQRVLWLLAAQYDGTNNGDLTLTRKQAAHYGLNNERHRSLGLRELERRGLIVKTRPGGVRNGSKVPTLWALAWRSIEHKDGQKVDVVTLPPNGWRKFDDTHVASNDPDSTTRTLLAPSENLGGACRKAPRRTEFA